MIRQWMFLSKPLDAETVFLRKVIDIEEADIKDIVLIGVSEVVEYGAQ